MEEESPNPIRDLIEKMDEEMRVIKDKSAVIEEQLRDFQSVEMEYVNREVHPGNLERSRAQRIDHISTFLDNVSERIEKELKKSYLKEFDIVVDYDRDLSVHTPMEASYRDGIERDIEARLGFSIDEYNKRTVAIEDRVLEICREIQDLMNTIRGSIQQLHRLELQFQYLTSFTGAKENDYDDPEFELVLNRLEKRIQDGMEEKIRKTIRENVAKIHFHFSTIKLLQAKLYQKVVTKYTCNICIQNNIDCYYDKCGHAICRGCGIRNRNSNVCPFCKSDSTLKQLFL
jgi:hypothetical protein